MKCIYPHCSADPAHCLPECKGRDYSQRTIANCHRHAVETIRATMWTHPAPLTPQAEMRAAILSRINQGQQS